MTDNDLSPVYDLDYALGRLRDAVDYAESDGDFQPLRKWVREVERSVRFEMAALKVEPEYATISADGE